MTDQNSAKVPRPGDGRYAIRYTEADLSAAEAAAAREAVEGVSDPGGEYYTGLYCGVEDRGITDRYEAAIYGWQQAFAFMESALAPPPPGALDRVRQAARAEGMEDAAKWRRLAEEAAECIERLFKINMSPASDGAAMKTAAAIRAAKDQPA